MDTYIVCSFSGSENEMIQINGDEGLVFGIIIGSRLSDAQE